MSRPILQSFEPWLRTKLALITQKTKLAEAIRYALFRWDGLCRFVEDGRMEIDSNVVERAIRPIATLESLCIRVVVSDATRATFSGHRRFDRFRRQVGGANLARRAQYAPPAARRI